MGKFELIQNKYKDRGVDGLQFDSFRAKEDYS
jgi:hypothetical protein